MWKKFDFLQWAASHQSRQVGTTFKPFAFSWKGQVLQVMQARSSDIANIVELESKAYHGHTPWGAAIFHQELRQKNALYLVVYQASALVALAGLRWEQVEAHITNLAVTPAWQAQGLGSRMLSILVQQAQKWGCQSLSLEVRADNEAAKGLYKNMGFVTTSVHPNYYQDVHQDGLKMVLQLTAIKEGD